MDQHIRSMVADLRKMSSGEAADWLMARYPADCENIGEALDVASHLSWKKADQLRLAEHYLGRLPFANAKPYQALASIMPVHRLVAVLKERIPSDESRRDLLWYLAGPVLTGAVKTARDREAVEAFMSEVKAD
jgi:hypothetical protein